MLSERNLEETALVYSLLGEITGTSRFLCDAPMFHIIGLVGNTRPALMNGAAFLVSDKFEPGRSLKRLSDPELAVSHYFCVPQMAAMIRNEPDFSPAKLKGLTALFTGGAPHPAANIREWLNDGIPIADGLGMSEAGTVFRMPLDMKLIDEHAGSVGVVTPRLQIRIVDADGHECPQGEAGELQLKGSCVTSGYWRRDEESKAAFSEDGWFCTGDIVRMDNDGFYWIVDRRKDMFISGGENVYPAEIEAVLAAQLDVAESAVVGVPDERWGEVGHLFLVPRSDANLDIETVIANLNTQLARYKIPKHCSVIDSLPRNAAGKIEKNKLRQLAADDRSEISRG
jgi:fatty-acyl-CoA synthase